MKLWLPLRPEGNGTRFAALALFAVLLLFAPGVLRLQAATVSPNLPIFGLLAGTIAMAAFGFLMSRLAARGNYVRDPKRNREVLITYVVMTCVFALTYGAGEILRSEVPLDPAADIDWKVVLLYVVGGQTAVLAYFVIFSRANKDAADVAHFRSLRSKANHLFQKLAYGKIGFAEFDKDFSEIEDHLKSMPDKAASIAQYLDKDEERYARDYAEAAKALATSFADVAGQSQVRLTLSKHADHLRVLGVSLPTSAETPTS